MHGHPLKITDNKHLQPVNWATILNQETISARMVCIALAGCTAKPAVKCPKRAGNSVSAF